MPTFLITNVDNNLQFKKHCLLTTCWKDHASNNMHMPGTGCKYLILVLKSATPPSESATPLLSNHDCKLMSKWNKIWKTVRFNLFRTYLWKALPNKSKHSSIWNLKSLLFFLSKFERKPFCGYWKPYHFNVAFLAGKNR